MSRRGGPVDYNEEAQKLFKLLNLDPSGAASEDSISRGYRDLDAVWQHPTTGAKVFIGNQTAAQRAEILQVPAPPSHMQ